MNFSLIFLGKYRRNELPHFTQMCFDCIKKYIVFDTSNYIKIGALYLLYGVFNKQPIKHYVRIRLVLEEFKVLSALMAEMKAQNHVEACYVYSKLLKDNAFDFVYSQCHLGLENKVLKADLKLRDDIFLTDRGLRKDVETVDAEMFKDIKDVDGKYQKLLKDYINKNPDVKFTSYSELVNKNLNELLGPTESTSTKVDDALSLKRKTIKEKAFRSAKK
ncbi:PREDICTED: snRNA-activating protein complex subunit 1-like isoform X2 [Nicrophorus vespilloides]|nr:PREDICTED: snRNA-activating protein complex subunit 1-like isoform X2 [Nicrophorus vespilloides]